MAGAIGHGQQFPQQAGIADVGLGDGFGPGLQGRGEAADRVAEIRVAGQAQLVAGPAIGEGLFSGPVSRAGRQDLAEGGPLVVEGRFQPLADGVAFAGAELFVAQGGSPAGGHRSGRAAAIKQGPVEAEARCPIGAALVQLGDHSSGAAALQGDHRAGREALGHPGLGEQAQAGQQLGGAAIGLLQQSRAGGLEGKQLGIGGQPPQQGLLQVEGPGRLQPHRLSGLEADRKGDIDQVAELAAAALLQGQGLLQAETGLLQVGFGPQQIQPRH